MATAPQKKSVPRKKPNGRRRKKSGDFPFRRLLIPTILALLVLASLTATLYIVFLRPVGTARVTPPPRSGPAPAAVPSVTRDAAPAAMPSHEEPTPALPQVYQPVTLPRLIEPGDTARKTRPRVAIIIDDLGYRQEEAANLLAIDMDLTLAFLPHAPHTQELVQQAAAKSRDVLLHLPMEPTDPKWDPGPGTLYTTMSDQTMAEVFTGDLAAVPRAIGVNNHMGSRFTENRLAMQTVLGLIKKNRLFFVDSVTSADSAGYSLATAMGIKTARRHVFLDNQVEIGAITMQLATLVRLAERHGWAVGIGHPHPETVAALELFRKNMLANIDVVGIHILVE